MAMPKGYRGPSPTKDSTIVYRNYMGRFMSARGTLHALRIDAENRMQELSAKDKKKFKHAIGCLEDAFEAMSREMETPVRREDFFFSE